MTRPGTAVGCYSERDLDALRELANMGAGAAATQLYTSTDQLVHMNVPRSTVVMLPAELSQFGPPEEEIAAVAGHVDGDIQMLLALLLSTQSADRLSSLASSTQQPSDVESGDALCDLGARMCAAFTSAVADATQQSLRFGHPQLISDMRGALLQSVVAHAATASDTLVMVDARLDLEGERLEVSFLWVAEEHGTARLLQRLGLSADDSSKGR